jgi:hypothetical protein
MNTYLIPREGRTQQEYFDYVGTLPWVFASDPAFQIDPTGQQVTVDGTIIGFEQVATSVPPHIPFVVDKTNFLERFTDTELATILTTAKTQIAIEVYVKRLNEAPTVDIAAPRTIAGVKQLETYGLIGVGRADQILVLR